VNFHLSEDQLLLKDNVERFLAAEYGFQRRRALLAAGGHSPAVWQALAGLGLLGAQLPEEYGGFGGGGIEAMVIMEAFGRHLVLEPFVGTAIVGAYLLQAMPVASRGGLAAQLGEGRLRLAFADAAAEGCDPVRLRTRARRSGDGWSLEGTKTIVSGGAVADRFFVAARSSGVDGEGRGISLFLVPRAAPGVVVEPCRLHDGQAAATVRLENVAVGHEHVVGAPDEALALLEEAADRAVAAVCAEAIGSAAYLLDTTCEYLKNRSQFGSPLARFQALQHRIAEMFAELELARSLSYLASASLDGPVRERQRRRSACKVQVTRASRFIGQNAVQLHGGMGVSEELDVAHHFKRLTVIGIEHGSHQQHLHRFVALGSWTTEADGAAGESNR
jgi:alkylation response protein AidB-like acyl-CoA dehydrogenase